MQTWLPRAYGESTAESAGLLAAVALNLAFYGMLRTWFDFLGEPGRLVGRGRACWPGR